MGVYPQISSRLSILRRIRDNLLSRNRYPHRVPHRSNLHRLLVIANSVVQFCGGGQIIYMWHERGFSGSHSTFLELAKVCQEIHTFICLLSTTDRAETRSHIRMDGARGSRSTGLVDMKAISLGFWHVFVPIAHISTHQIKDALERRYQIFVDVIFTIQSHVPRSSAGEREENNLSLSISSGETTRSIRRIPGAPALIT